MIKVYLFSLFFALFVNTLFAQDDVIFAIRQEYNDYSKLIENSKEEGLDFFPPGFEINTVQNRPALGPVAIKITYYYTEIGDEEEPDWYKNQAVIRKVIYIESMPSYKDYREFFYNESGQILFYYSKLTGYSCGEKRLYFSNGKLIKIKFNPLEGADCIGDEKFPDFTRLTGKLTKDDLDWEKWVLDKAKIHVKAIENLYKGTQ